MDGRSPRSEIQPLNARSRSHPQYKELRCRRRTEIQPHKTLGGRSAGLSRLAHGTTIPYEVPAATRRAAECENVARRLAAEGGDHPGFPLQNRYPIETRSPEFSSGRCMALPRTIVSRLARWSWAANHRRPRIEDSAMMRTGSHHDRRNSTTGSKHGIHPGGQLGLDSTNPAWNCWKIVPFCRRSTGSTLRLVIGKTLPTGTSSGSPRLPMMWSSI